MSILDVKNVSHGFGSRVILEDASFRLLKGEHIGLVGANGEGKTTFLNISQKTEPETISSRLLPAIHYKPIPIISQTVICLSVNFILAILNSSCLVF